ncbi:TPA: restriction endonuclease [Vibrio vulnificus]|uniref:restriction endonuclease n=1 Tax=Vibrio vulnificus TaxID=672 RepID=UPI00163C1692|nr:restriction endonuclease [Vibrio vulnificus]EID7697348.1 restriction endonuclease [Vibrio parahaemolyticus]EJG1427163.1 restriction endonuclease [Vibrio parahaemolyticus]ELF6474476.1 restriction endonuclease [Vibrio vulnificus]MDS1842019.1 restriction endonuclease [Vibrio vulnificus]MDS1850687.1 restriction endonuclease [Vibrio vulnificus]
MSYDQFELDEDSLYLNGKVIIDGSFDNSLEWLASNFSDTKTCPICKTHLLDFWSQNEVLTDRVNFDSEFINLKLCRYCNYWQWHHENPYKINTYGCLDHYTHSGISKIRTYDELPYSCHHELAVAFRRNPKLWHTINPTEFEKLVASIFRANYAECEVIHVGKPDDGGVDVIFIDSGEKQWLIQVKRRESENSSEGISTIRNLLGTMVLKNSAYGILASTADHFTHRANEAVGLARSQGMHLELMDRGVLDRMIGKLLPSNPVAGFISENYSSKISSIFSSKIAGVYGRE